MKNILIILFLTLAFPLTAKAELNPFPELAVKSKIIELNDAKYKYVAYTGEGSIGVIRVFDQKLSITASFRPFDKSYTSGIIADAKQFIAVAQKKSPNSVVKIFTLQGEEIKTFVTNLETVDKIEILNEKITVTSVEIIKEFSLDGVEIKIAQDALVQIPKEPQVIEPQPKVQKIEVDITKQELVAYEDGAEVMRSKVSTGLWRYPTPRGTFSVLKKIQIKDYVWSYGVNHNDNYNLPNVKHNLMFKYPYYIHGAYWHNNFGRRMSHGCVNLPLDFAEKLFNWAEVGAVVHIFESSKMVTK